MNTTESEADEPVVADMDIEALIATRRGLHTIAEHILSVDLHRSTGKIGLRRTTAGFGQPEHLIDGQRRRLRVDGTHLVVTTGDHEVWHELSTLRAAGGFVGLLPGTQTGVFAPTTTPVLDEQLLLNAVSAQALARWAALVEAALEELRRRSIDRNPTIVQWWPEHFDQSFSMSDTNFGGSCGDDGHEQPYCYVGPWSPIEGPFWNEPWGASRSWTDITSVGNAVAFFEEGIDHLNS